jgi:hypothetical protein
MLMLEWPGHGEFHFQFGAAEFDGCGAAFAHRTEVRGHPALVSRSAVIWPATPNHPTGTYGIEAPLPPREILAMADSMPVLSGHGSDGNC